MNAHAITSSASQGSVGSYAARLCLSFLLILVPFGAIMAGIVPSELSRPAIVVLCVGQVLVQIVWSLHPGTRKDQRENTANFVCTGLVIAIMVAGYFR
ncbi:cytochrome o ubiquinol/quinol oxidase subunit IV [Telluria sp. Tellsp104]